MAPTNFGSRLRADIDAKATSLCVDTEVPSFSAMASRSVRPAICSATSPWRFSAYFSE